MKITYPPVILLSPNHSICLVFYLSLFFILLLNLSILFGIFVVLVIGISLVYISLKKLSKMETTFIPDGEPIKLSSGWAF